MLTSQSAASHGGPPGPGVYRRAVRARCSANGAQPTRPRPGTPEVIQGSVAGRLPGLDCVATREKITQAIAATRASIWRNGMAGVQRRHVTAYARPRVLCGTNGATPGGRWVGPRCTDPPGSAIRADSFRLRRVEPTGSRG
jgi:hypothetical protein